MNIKLFLSVVFVLAFAFSGIAQTHTYNNKEKFEGDASVEVVSRADASRLLTGGIVGGTYFLKNSNYGFRCEASWSRSSGVGSLITTLCGGEAKMRKGTSVRKVAVQPFAVALAGMTNESPYSRHGLIARPDLGIGIDLGAGADFPVTKNISIRGRGDYLLSRIAIGGDIPTRSSIRGSIGVVVSLK